MLSASCDLLHHAESANTGINLPGFSGDRGSSPAMGTKWVWRVSSVRFVLVNLRPCKSELKHIEFIWYAEKSSQDYSTSASGRWSLSKVPCGSRRSWYILDVVVNECRSLICVVLFSFFITCYIFLRVSRHAVSTLVFFYFKWPVVNSSDELNSFFSFPSFRASYVILLSKTSYQIRQLSSCAAGLVDRVVKVEE